MQVTFFSARAERRQAAPCTCHCVRSTSRPAEHLAVLTPASRIAAALKLLMTCLSRRRTVAPCWKIKDRLRQLRCSPSQAALKDLMRHKVAKTLSLPTLRSLQVLSQRVDAWHWCCDRMLGGFELLQEVDDACRNTNSQSVIARFVQDYLTPHTSSLRNVHHKTHARPIRQRERWRDPEPWGLAA